MYFYVEMKITHRKLYFYSYLSHLTFTSNWYEMTYYTYQNEIFLRARTNIGEGTEICYHLVILFLSKTNQLQRN